MPTAPLDRHAHLLSWGRHPAAPQAALRVHWPDQVAATLRAHGGGLLPYGNGRSYGDSGLAASDTVLDLRGMDRLVAADWTQGRIIAQGGMLLDELIRLALPRGWFPAVTPGTRFITLGGAIANDVHGKNHHHAGTFGCHVRRLALARSDRGVLICSRDQHPALFAATVGGLGLTGVILWVELQLQPVTSHLMDTRTRRFSCLEEGLALSAELDARHQYAVAWIDCAARGRRLGRGLHLLGDHAREGGLQPARPRARRMPLDPPVSLINRWTLRAFNSLHYHRHSRRRQARVSYLPYFYPLDGLHDWNRLYGRRGFQQFQCLIPERAAGDALPALLQAVTRAGTGSPLAVLKRFGDRPSPGLLSFPAPGLTLALDFPNTATVRERLLPRLDAIVREADGRLYPAKDAHMSGADFRRGYPDWDRVEALRDPALNSRFWQRMQP